MSRERHPWGADGRPIDWPEPDPLDAIAKRNDSGNDCGEEWCCTACQGTGWAGMDLDPCSDCYGTGHAHSQRKRTHLPVTRRNP